MKSSKPTDEGKTAFVPIKLSDGTEVIAEITIRPVATAAGLPGLTHAGNCEAKHGIKPRTFADAARREDFASWKAERGRVAKSDDVQRWLEQRSVRKEKVNDIEAAYAKAVAAQKKGRAA